LVQAAIDLSDQTLPEFGNATVEYLGLLCDQLRRR
jgi:hypothetical protein